MKSIWWCKPLIGLMGIVTLASCGGGGSGGNSAPEAQGVELVDVNGGSVAVGDLLEVDYVYFDQEDDAEGNTSFEWFRGDALIEGATSDAYTIQDDDRGSYLSVRVVPRAESGTSVGLATRSDTLLVSSDENIAPVAVAGADVNITLGDTVNFDGSASQDPDGSIVYYLWVSDAWTLGHSGATPSVTFPESGTFTVTLTVRDNGGVEASDSLVVHVAGPDNQAPIADAGEDFQIIAGSTANFDGRGSIDPDGSIVSYSWNDGTLSGAQPSLVYNTPGTFTVTLLVTDNAGATDTDNVVVTVISANTPPSADAGADITVNLGDAVTFDASASVDAEGEISSYIWEWEGLSENLSGVAPTYTFTEAGVVTVTLTITDAEGASATDEVVVTVNAPPVAEISASASTIMPGDSVAFSAASSTDSDGEITSYVWSSASWSDDLVGSEQTIVFTEPGDYVVTLSVTDDNGASNSASITITVGDLPNAPPVASVGASKEITVGVAESVTLNGAASTDPEGDIASYSWSSPLWAQPLAGVQQTVVFDTAGTFVITLTVVDGGGLEDTDTLTVTVEDETPALEAEAGPDQTVTVGDAVTLDASASVVSGEVITYSWSSDAWPSELSGVSQSVTFDTAGTYVVTLTVSADGVSDTDTVTITVNDPENQAPVANAGADFEIEVGSTATFDGSASTDPEDGTPSDYAWTSTAWEGSLSGVAPQIILSSVGEVLVTLTVTDSEGATATDTVLVTVVEEPGNQVPVAVPGASLNVVIGATVALDGSASFDEDGEVVSYSWSNKYWTEDLDSATESVSFDAVGPYTLTLTVTDDEGASGSADLLVNVVQPDAPAWMDGDENAIFQTYPGVYKEGDTWTIIFHAPAEATGVKIFGEFTGSITSDSPVVDGVELIPTPDGQFWWLKSIDEAFLRAPVHGDQYRFAMEIDGTIRTTQDPAARWVTNSSVNPMPFEIPDVEELEAEPSYGMSRILMSDDYVWKTTDWVRPEWSSYNIYQIHPSRFTDRNGAANPFAEVAEELNGNGTNDYITNLGVSSIQLLPVYEFTGDESWGYNPSFFYAIESAYGGPNALKALVDEAHAQGISVVLDIVLNHMSTTDNVLWTVDQETYVDGDTFWGALPNFNNPVAKHFLNKHVAYLAEEYKIDGFRFDSTHTVHRSTMASDTIRVPGDGGGWELLVDLYSELKSIDPGILTIAEELPDWWGLTAEATDTTPHGPMDSQWAGEFHYTFRDVLQGVRAPSALWGAGAFGNQGDSWQDALLYIDSHDTAGNCDCRFTAFSGSKGWQVTQVGMAGAQLGRGIPMSFMGFESGEWLQFKIDEGDVRLDVDGYEDETNTARQKLIGWFVRLNEIRALDPQALAQGDSTLLHANDGNKVIAFSRDGGRYVIAMNLSDSPYFNYSVGISGRYRELANTSWPAFNISGVTEATRGGDAAQDISSLHIPANGAVILVRE